MKRSLRASTAPGASFSNRVISLCHASRPHRANSGLCALTVRTDVHASKAVRRRYESCEARLSEDIVLAKHRVHETDGKDAHSSRGSPRAATMRSAWNSGLSAPVSTRNSSDILRGWVRVATSKNRGVILLKGFLSSFGTVTMANS